MLLVAPLECARRATIPCGDPTRWNRFYACANAALSPLLLTRLVVGFSGRELGDVFAGLPGSGGLGFEGSSGSGGKLGFVGLWMASFAAAAVLWRVTADDAPPRWWTDGVAFVDAVAFLCSVAWIAAAARELTECLAAIGDAVGASPASLSVTVLAIGNSLGDLATDVATARSGQPTMAVAACFSGPLFNMAVGLGGSFAIATWRRAGGGGGPPPSGTHRHPGGGPLPLAAHPTVAIGFGFLIVGLVATAALVPMRGYVVTRGHGFGLIALYATYMACAVAVEVLTDGGGGGTMSEPSSAAARWR